ncbi:hypothetical protein Taro_036841 [Colocasia esculenta]|uniref:Uncharacterized protein n=1 Tax=Colocasia esculenta TaxID=4460 RepID=A0A843W449_COLES|nr:hypothetical protein [Colocasia esculenta]
MDMGARTSPIESPLRFIPTPSAKELGITFRTGIRIAYVTTIRNRHSETVDRALVSRNSVPGPKFSPRACIGIAYGTTIRNRHSEMVDKALVLRNTVPSSDSLDYANRWRTPHAKPSSQSDRKSCSIRREISSPGIGIAYVTTIRNRHSEKVDRALVLRNSVPGQKFPPERTRSTPPYCLSSDSLDYANHGRTPQAEWPSHSDRKSCSTRREISSPDALDGPLLPQYRLPRLRESLADPTHEAVQSQRSEVVFSSTRDLLPRSWIWVPNIADVNRHSETVDRALVLRNSVPGPKFRPERTRSTPPYCLSSDSLDYANHWRTPQAERPSHSDRKSCSTRREISSPGRGYGCPNIADIATSFDALDAPLLPQPTISPIPRFSGSSDSLDYANHWRTPQAERPSHSDRKSCSTRREISSPGRGYGIGTLMRSTATYCLSSDSLDFANRWRSPHAEPPSHSDRKSSKELGITLRTGLGIAYVTTIRNRHSETVDKALVSWNSVPGPKSPPERVY